MINGVIFDMDGLMFDTERMWATFWKPALTALGLEYKEGLAEAERGTAGETSRNIVRQFCKKHALFNLGAVILLSVVILFYNDEWDCLHLLICSETLAAIIAQPSAPDRAVVISRS